MRLFTAVAKIIDRLSGGLRTRAAREVATFHPTAKLTRDGDVQNILGEKAAISVGAHSVISGSLRTHGHGGRIRVGDWVFVGPGSHIWSVEAVEIGSRVLISHGVTIVDSNAHPLDARQRFDHTRAILAKGHPRMDPGLLSAAVRIEDDAWISFGAAILKGVTIGRGAIVGASAVVTRDVAPWTVVAGNPARVINRLDPVDVP